MEEKYSILVTKTPKSCSECKFGKLCNKDINCLALGDLIPLTDIIIKDRVYEQYPGNDYFDKRHPQCPLQDTTDLLKDIKKDIERTEYILGCEIEVSAVKRVNNIRYNLLKLHKALGGKQ